MKRRTGSKPKRPLLGFLGLLLCVIPPVACTLAYFPLWREAGAEKLLSGGVVLLLVLSAMPLFRLIRQRLRTVAVWGIWLLLFLLFFALSRIADEMTVIAFTGFISNLLGASLIRLSRSEGGAEKTSVSSEMGERGTAKSALEVTGDEE